MRGNIKYKEFGLQKQEMTGRRLPSLQEGLRGGELLHGWKQIVRLYGMKRCDKPLNVTGGGGKPPFVFLCEDGFVLTVEVRKINDIC